ncbi:MAG: amidohydrolase family protein [Planctomycetaceae bacterium]
MIVDVNVNLSRWPFRRLPFDKTPELVRKLRQNGVTQAWAGSFDAVLHNDMAAVNARLVAECRRHDSKLLLPVGSINPTLPDWREDLRRCHQVHGMHAIRLHPNYHGYTLGSDACHELCALASKQRLIVQLVLRIEDERSHHPLLQVPTVDTAPLEELVVKHKDLRLIVMNNYGTVRGAALGKLVKSGHVFFEISHSEQVGALEKFVKQVPYERVLWGSHFPFFNLEATTLKFRESRLGDFITKAIQHTNAQQLWDDTQAPRTGHRPRPSDSYPV